MSNINPPTGMLPAAIPYNGAFFSSISESAMASARVVVPLVVDLIQPECVIDVGCGLGQWLRVFQECGVSVVRGYDGSYVDSQTLHIDPSQFTKADLTHPLVLDRRYDLAVCLEVAEHLPTRRSTGLVKDLTKAAPVVLFSAAIPGQGGTNHINEQWPFFWRDRFSEFGYVRLDPFRPRIWHDKTVAPWYRQNLYLFASREVVSASPALRVEQARGESGLELIDAAILARYQSFTGLLFEFPKAFWRATRRWIG